jgi:hypothetical protein
MATKDILDRVLDACGEQEQGKSEGNRDFISRICSAINDLSDKKFEALDDDIQEWANAAIREIKDENWKAVPDLGDISVVTADKAAKEAEPEKPARGRVRVDELPARRREAADDDPPARNRSRRESTDDDPPARRRENTDDDPPARSRAREEEPAKAADEPVKRGRGRPRGSGTANKAAASGDGARVATSSRAAESQKLRKLMIQNPDFDMGAIKRLSIKKGLELDESVVKRVYNNTKPVIDLYYELDLVRE